MCGTIIGVNIKMRKNIIRKRKDTIIKEFVSYVYDFYGKGEYTFCGDSLDRERVRDIMISKFNLKEII